MPEIIPAILTDSALKFKDLVFRLEPYTQRIHIDVADGVFVPNKTFVVYEELDKVEAAVKFDIHLMVKQPAAHLREWLYTHADRFIIHVESEGDLGSVIEEFHKNHRKVGLTLNPETSTDKLEPFVTKVDFVQFMTVHPGFQGGEFVESVLDKVREFNKKYPKIPIAVDGSMHVETARLAVNAGASIIVVGGHVLFENRDLGEAINELKQSCTI